jgi:ABC-type transporter Mla subunit MlaD
MGLNSIEAADMSEQLFVLAGDLQAFNPAAGSTEDALNALQAAIRGEFDPLERFGAKLSAAEINERALANTGKDTTAELTAQDKALATLELALEKTTIQVGALEDAEKDGRRETEKLTASVRDLRVEFGTKLAPIADDLTGALGNLTGSMGDASGRSFLLLDAIKVLTGGLEDNTEAFEGDAAQVDTFTDAVAGATDWLGKALGFISPLSNALHDQADAWRDDAREAGKASNAFQVASLNMVRVVDPAGKAANAIVGVGSAARLTASRLASLTSQAKATVNALRSVAAQQDITKAGPTLYATGGTVPGPRGAPQAAIVHGGERILTPGQQRDGGGGGGGGGPVTINVVAGISDPQAVAEAVAEAIRLYERTNGRVL